MNKKLIVLILFIFLLLSTVVISIFGKKPDPPVVHVEEIVFVAGEGDKTEVNEEGLFVVIINIDELEETQGKYVIKYQLNYILNPENAANKIVRFNVENPDQKDLVTFTSTGLVTIELSSKVSTDITVIVTSADDASRASAKMIIRLEAKQIEDMPTL